MPAISTPRNHRSFVLPSEPGDRDYHASTTRLIADARFLVIAGVHRGIVVFEFDPDHAEPRATLDLSDLDPLDTVEIGTITVSPDERHVVIASSGFGVVAGYDATTRTRPWNYEYGGGNPSAIQARYSPDGSRVAVFGQGYWTARLVDARTGATIPDLGDRWIHELQPTDDPHVVLAAGVHGRQRIDVETGRTLEARYDLAGGGSLAHLPIGFVFADAAALSRVHRLVGSGSDDLATLAPYLLDHKKIRAAAAGIAVTPPSARADLR